MTDEGEKGLVVERLYKKCKRAAFQRSCANSGCFPTGHHDHFRVGQYLAEPCLHFQPARLWHPHIEHGQGHCMATGVREKNLRVFEALRLQPIRIEELRAYAKGNLPPGSAKAVAQAIDEIEFRSEFKQRLLQQLAAWIKKKDSISAAPSPAASTDSVPDR